MTTAWVGRDYDKNLRIFLFNNRERKDINKRHKTWVLMGLTEKICAAKVESFIYSQIKRIFKIELQKTACANKLHTLPTNRQKRKEQKWQQFYLV
jgi:hypothetical protein